ncbi:MAG TPA: quinone-dependent dihydroorotate dehydrogenase [Steroidobacteraceae bacterium]|jgi:dihydroorotate dehydrogenase subfamily 2|nr:quinone-dependent dihydroorotate dehydrogenase [Steroidobacteraceae bacterium]
MSGPAVTALARASLPILTRLDPERAHDWGLAGLKILGPFQTADTGNGRARDADLSVRCFGLDFAHPLGLAAGFDKNGDYLDALGAMGFSHVELGTVTPRPQPGNPKPRMFRIRDRCALINRMGFNNKGVEHLVARLGASRYRGVRGISIGKNFDTPIERAEDDYLICLRKVYAHADYVAVNISSPNTARLRELQGRDGLEKLLRALLEERSNLVRQTGKRVPLVVKVAPDLTTEQISAVAQTVRALEIDGIIATNTSTGREGIAGSPAAEQAGGLSGAPLHALSVRVISQLRSELGPEFPIIGVGGIVSADAAMETLRAGASLIQIYTGFAYRGPALIDDVVDALTP